ncbi:MAG: hypothetical protein V9F46_09890 [Chitinophagaceae bacterium]
MPLSIAKNVAVSSFYTYGTTQLYDVNTNSWTQVKPPLKNYTFQDARRLFRCNA